MTAVPDLDALAAEIAPDSETPRHNWGLKGATGDELALDYKVDV